MALDSIVSQKSITLQVSNMYADGRIIQFSDGSTLLVRDRIEYKEIEPDDYYPVKYNDRITSIAYKYYKRIVILPSHYYWVIADANNIINPLDLSSYVGKEIVIPNILNFKLTN